jgi:hypothetical protein
MSSGQIVPTISMFLSFGASAVCGVTGDTGRCVYWMAAGVITFAVTFMVKGQQ